MNIILNLQKVIKKQKKSIKTVIKGNNHKNFENLQNVLKK